MKSNQLIISIVLVFAFSACGNNENETETVEKSSITATDSKNENALQKVYSLPSTMQVSSFLKTNNAKYQEDLIKGNIKNPESAVTTIQKALSLGLYGVDLGYTVSYEQNQQSINYLVKVAKISDDLKISGVFKKETIDRFKSNITKPDSLTYISLSAFNDANNYLIQNGNKDVQYLIGAGALVEGLYLTLSTQKKEAKQQNANVIGMHKFYLNSLLELLLPYAEKQAEVKELVAQLDRIKKAFDGVNVEIVSEGDSQTIKDVQLSDNQLEDILKEVLSVRKSIIG